MLWPFARRGHTNIIIVRTWMLWKHGHYHRADMDALVTRTLSSCGHGCSGNTDVIIVRTWMLWPETRQITMYLDALAIGTQRSQVAGNPFAETPASAMVLALVCHWRLEVVDDVPVTEEHLQQAKEMNQQRVLEVLSYSADCRCTRQGLAGSTTPWHIYRPLCLTKCKEVEVAMSAQSLLESLAVGPADLPAALQPLLSVSLSEVCAAYQRFGGEDSVCVEDICDQLPLDARAARQLTAGQKCLPTRELLATLVLASRTHAFTKARLIFDLCDFSGEGRLQLEHFFQAVSSFLAAAVRLGSGIRRPVLPRKHVLDSLAFGLFRAYDSEMSKDDFMKMVKSQDHVGRLLRRFARGAYDEAFRIPSWKELAESKTPGSQESEDAANLRREPSRLPQGDLLDAPLPRRRGYFLAVQSSREVALHNELETIQRERASAEKTLHSAIDLEMRERAIREELVTECADEVARREYRRRLQKLWHRSRPKSASCTRDKRGVVGRRLWTASSSHVARGGVLPAGVPRPLTPSWVQAAVNSVVSSSTAPSRTIEDRVRQEFSSQDDGSISAHEARRISTGTTIRSCRASLVSPDGDEASLASDTLEGGEQGRLFRKADVLLAFDLYRDEYWLREGGGMRSLLQAGMPLHPPREMTKMEAADRRKGEIELMLKEISEEKPAALTPTASVELTLRGFLQAVFPFAKKTDIRTMLRWIKHPPSDDKVKTRHGTSVKPDFGLLRDLIDLFDAIDTARTHSVPVEAVEQFLSGEIITQGETARLRQRRQARTDLRSVTNAACYAHNPRVALILNRMLEDRADWQVTIPSHQDHRGKRHTVSGHGWRSLEHKMEALAATLDEELHALAHGDENLLTESIEAACNPWHHDDYVWRAETEEGQTDPGAPKKVRLVRLYWRYMIGSAIVQQLRDEPSRLALNDGKLDLFGFMCVLAQDQIRLIFPLNRHSDLLFVLWKEDACAVSLWALQEAMYIQLLKWKYTDVGNTPVRRGATHISPSAMSKKCVLHLLDTGLLSEYTGTCNEYTGYVKKPGFCRNIKDMLTCRGAEKGRPSRKVGQMGTSVRDYSTAFREWGVLQLYVAVIVAILVAIIDIIANEVNIVNVLVNLFLQICAAYIFAHLGWFGVTQKDGCFCCIIACCECPPILLFWGILMMFWGVGSVGVAFQGVGNCAICVIKPCVQFIHAVILFYMGFCCLNIWIQHGKEILPPSVDVTGPQGEVIGAA
ncbi:unnamed protein product [Symbiodinium natans]|uniref:Uncharacterized protein n=1 Tax=Symbiodinium natans TaxID=878477 RepID=A0A812J4P6_9DINO|nr:unnamed protein product [Symbiodinium natans]